MFSIQDTTSRHRRSDLGTGVVVTFLYMGTWQRAA